MLELKQDTLHFSFPEVHPDAKLTIHFQRTLRIPDDGKHYGLPPGLGKFPVRHLDDHKANVPAEWAEKGGVLLPMFQSEALWVKFNAGYATRQGQYPFAIKISAGLRSAVTGEARKDGLTEKDYVVSPKQPWLDGFVVEKGSVRQFVAAPLGMGFTVEEQLTGKAEFGGLQIEVFPMKREVFDKRYPVKVYEASAGITRGGDYSYGENVTKGVLRSRLCVASARGMSMGMGAGGQMKQQIFEDPYLLSDWDTAAFTRCYVHLVNSMSWKSITGQAPPHAPATAKDYARAGLPWYDYYKDEVSLGGTSTMAGVKSVAEMEQEKGIPFLPENESLEIKNVKVLTPQASPKDKVRDGAW